MSFLLLSGLALARVVLIPGIIDLIELCNFEASLVLGGADLAIADYGRFGLIFSSIYGCTQLRRSVTTFELSSV